MGLAARGARQLGDRVELLTSEEEINYFRRRARWIYIKTFLSTLALMLVTRAYHWLK